LAESQIEKLIVNRLQSTSTTLVLARPVGLVY